MKYIDLDKFPIETTEKAKWNKSRFHSFKTYATQEEFLKSQIPFFFAVQAFPRFLCLLASKIPTSEVRYGVVENIWEEHGCGQSHNFHVNSYLTYLKAIGYTNERLESSPWVDGWIDSCLKYGSNTQSYEFAAYLSGIEYIYAYICKDIVSYIDSLELTCPQTHYANHSVLDLDHGHELWNIAIRCVDLSESYQSSRMQKAFKKGQEDFIELYGNLFMPTLAEMHEIHKDPISFYYSRENSELEISVLNKISPEETPEILVICSGGEHVFEFMKNPAPLNITAIDMNPAQIKVAQDKYNWLTTKDGKYKIPDVMTTNEFGKFEKVFSIFRSYFNGEDISDIYHHREEGSNKLVYLTNILFSNEYLNAVFGEDATRFTKESFSNHFTSVFFDTMEDSKNTENIFTGRAITDWASVKKEIKGGHKIDWAVGGLKNYSSDKKFDIIDISNIGDWMPQEDFQKILSTSYELLNSGGYIIVRKLLGDYSLEESLKSHKFITEEGKDSTGFYSEVLTGLKK